MELTLWFLISLTPIVIIAQRMVNTNILSILIISILVLLKPTNYYLASTSIGLPFFIK